MLFEIPLYSTMSFYFSLVWVICTGSLSICRTLFVWRQTISWGNSYACQVNKISAILKTFLLNKLRIFNGVFTFLRLFGMVNLIFFRARKAIGEPVVAAHVLAIKQNAPSRRLTGSACRMMASSSICIRALASDLATIYWPLDGRISAMSALAAHAK